MSRVVRITQLDGKLPNLALMRLTAWHKSIGDEVHVRSGSAKSVDEPEYDIVYGSAIFSTSGKAVEKFRDSFPNAIVGGSGGDPALRVENIVPQWFKKYDYTGYPDFNGSIGYAMRGCRFKCGFCVVPKQEGSAKSENTINEIWRGEPYPKHLHLLDNDFFGNPDWELRTNEIVDGGFKVCLNQGINVRLLSGEAWNVPKNKRTPEIVAAAEELADRQCQAIVRMGPRDDQFRRRRLYCAWDNLGDEEVFFKGIDRLEKFGWKPQWVFTYMLVGYDPRETWDKIWHRFNRMVERKVMPYPMVYDRFRTEDPEHYRKLKQFQRWAVRGIYRIAPFSEYDPAFKSKPRINSDALMEWLLSP